MEGIRRIDSWTRIDRAVGGPDACYERAPGYAEVVRGMHAAPEKMALLRALDGAGAGGGDLRAAAGLPDFEVCRTLWAFRVIGLVRRVGRTSAAGADSRTRAWASSFPRNEDDRSPEEKRRTPRIQPFVAPATSSPGARRMAAYLTDLSLDGARVACDAEPPALEEWVTIEVRLPRQAERSSLPGRVKWVQPGGEPQGPRLRDHVRGDERATDQAVGRDACWPSSAAWPRSCPDRRDADAMTEHDGRTAVERRRADAPARGDGLAGA